MLETVYTWQAPEAMNGSAHVCVCVCRHRKMEYDGGNSRHKFVDHYSCIWSELWLSNSFATLESDLWNSGEQLLWVDGDGCIFQNNTEMWTVNILRDFYGKKKPYFFDVVAQNDNFSLLRYLYFCFCKLYEKVRNDDWVTFIKRIAYLAFVPVSDLLRLLS